MRKEDFPHWNGCLAPRPIAFHDSGNFVSISKVLENLPSDF